MKIVAFAATSSRDSINKQLVTYASGLVSGADVEILDINDYELPLFSTDREKELGQPDLAKAFFNKLGEADAIVISFAEHNGSYTAAYKNLFDWTSRIDMKLFQNKPMVLLATSPGPGGARNVLATAVSGAPHFAGNVVGQFSLPSFYDTFDMEKGEVKDESANAELVELMSKLSA
ncbi:putative Flavoprotein [Vibrio nigripulchritudo MADA3029]|uniref:NADPH-dependent FMN reductase n=1 Tax=Vibrio nigripulchritudo TaxID=28173 RepID=UPI0003B1DCF5|nr:NAD(P)H-dependent oxidoreductase [Vibrio nigripulchritudo]CCN48536.1 putative Flavoprotein [Vibrio nigripulchritudo MADA3020]CCN55596.1 putative Flavoprotein [Vibrio nigripulchritudo MADA3021]CCN60743.1 putative Flavoprotein [Vibrio nigripulchritudo MADA3029]